MLRTHCSIDLISQKITSHSHNVTCPCCSPRFTFLICGCISAVVRFFVFFFLSCVLHVDVTSDSQITTGRGEQRDLFCRFLQPAVMSHLEQAACLCFINRGLGDTVFNAGPVDVCTRQRPPQQSRPPIQRKSMQRRYLSNQSPLWMVTDR